MRSDQAKHPLLAGSEPTACILSFAVAVIHLHPDVLQQLQSEIDEVLGKKRKITYEDLSNLKYTEQVTLHKYYTECM